MRILLTSRYAMWMGWGPELTFLYNDAYGRQLGAKHPWALGRPAREVWAEIWGDIGPRIESVLGDRQATWDEALLLFLERSGYPEETYHTFSYSPLPTTTAASAACSASSPRRPSGSSASAGCATLRELARRPRRARTEAEVLAAVDRALGAQPARPAVHPHLPVRRRRRRAARLRDAGSTPAHPAAPAVLAPADASRSGRRGDCGRVTPSASRTWRDASRRCPCGAWTGRRRAAVVRRSAQAPARPAGLPGRRPQPATAPSTTRYRGFIELVGRPDRAGARERARLRGGAAARRGARRARPRQDRVLLQRQPRVPHAADADARPARGAARRPTMTPTGAARASWSVVHRNALRLLQAGQHPARLLPHRGGPGAGPASSRPTSRALTAELASMLPLGDRARGLAARSSTARRSPSRSTSTATCGRRSSSTCSPTPSSSPSRARSRSRLRADGRGGQLDGRRHRHRHPGGRAAAPLRALPPRRGRARRAPRRAAASGWRWSRSWSACTAARSTARASPARAPRSRCASRSGPRTCRGPVVARRARRRRVARRVVGAESS